MTKEWIRQAAKEIVHRLTGGHRPRTTEEAEELKRIEQYEIDAVEAIIKRRMPKP